MKNARVDRHEQWALRLAVATSIFLFVMTVSGLALWLLPFSVPTQILVFAHTLIGVLFFLPVSWYLVKHWWTYRGSLDDPHQAPRLHRRLRRPALQRVRDRLDGTSPVRSCHQHDVGHHPHRDHVRDPGVRRASHRAHRSPRLEGTSHRRCHRYRSGAWARQATSPSGRSPLSRRSLFSSTPIHRRGSPTSFRPITASPMDPSARSRPLSR